jgi:glutamine synthetase
MVVINTIMAEALDYCATTLETAVAAGTDFNEAVQSLLSNIVADHGAVIFNGNGYSEEWPLEAEQRGLKNLRTTVDALPELISPEAIELFGKYSVFSDREMHSRYEIGLEQYILTVSVEANLTLEIGTTTVLPAAIRYQTELASNVAALKAAGVDADLSTLLAVSAPINELRAGLATLADAIAHEHDEDALVTATSIRDVVLPAMNAVRAAADTLETLVADDLWPLPTYQEMLYIL